MRTNPLLRVNDRLGGLTVEQKLILITCLGFVLRLYVVLNAVTISTDSITYIRLAREFSEGNYLGILDRDRPPLYPLLLSLASFVFHDPELSGRVVSLLFGTLVIPVTFRLGRLVYNERAGVITAFFVAIHPYMVRYSGDILTEALYYFLVASTTLLGLKAMKERSIRTMLLAGLSSVLTYLTKPGGIGFMMIISALTVFYNPTGLKREWKKRVLLAVSGWWVFLVLAFPYLLYLSRDFGEIRMTGRGTMADVMETVWRILTQGAYVVDFAKHYPEAFSIPFFLLFLVFLWKLPGRVRRRELTSIEVCFIVIQLFYYFIYLVAGARRRYLVQIMPLGMVFAAMGYIYIEDYLRRRKGERGTVIVTALLLFFTAVQLPQGMVRLKAHHLPEKVAGRWFHENMGGGVPILIKTPIMVYYARGEYIALPDGPTRLDEFVEYGRRNGAEYMAGYTRKLRKRITDFDGEKDRLLDEVASFYGEEEGEFVIYRFVDLAAETDPPGS